MQPSDQPVDLIQLKKAWEKFVTTAQVAAGVDPVIASSWQRCASRLSPGGAPQWSYAGTEVPPLSAVQREFLRTVARPVMEDIYQFIEGSETLLVLADNGACISEMIGDPHIDEYAQSLGFQPGAFLDEERIGTNAFSIALSEGFPAQVVGPEHFLSVFHGIYSAAAPIHEPAGKPIGVIGLIQKAGQPYAHALGITFAAARAIENQLQAEHFIHEANLQATEFLATLDAVSDGVLAWNNRHIITHLNRHGGELLGLKPSMVVGRPLTEYISFPEVLARAIAKGEELNNIEVVFHVNGAMREVLVSLRVIRQPSSELSAFIATLRPIAQVHQLVTRLVGAQARLTLEDIIGQGPAIQEVRHQSLAAVNSNKGVLLLGEQGTGKNSLARAIHNSGSRAAGPFLAINCRTIPRKLVLGEFLGFEPGAFNSAAGSGQPSKFELADKGTLLLEEVDALPLEMQSALTRILDAGEVIRLGGTRAIPVDVRIIASTQTDLEKKLAEGSFREDLYNLLSAFVIRLPSLRERPEDIPLLIDRSLERLRLQYGHSLSISVEAKDILISYPWPGNIVELDSVIERASANCGGGVIKVEHLPDSVREIHKKIQHEATTAPVRTLKEAERQAILTAIQNARGNLSKAAKILCVSRNTLYRKIKEYGFQDIHIPPQ